MGRVFNGQKVTEGKTARAVSAESGINMTTLNRLLGGNSEFSLREFLVLCAVLDLAPGDALGRALRVVAKENPEAVAQLPRWD